MAQPNAKRLQFNAIQELTSALNDDRQTLTQTALIKVGDTLEFWDRNASGCLETLVGTRVVTGVCPDEAITLDSAIDLTSVTGTAVIRNRTIDDVQEAISRLYDCGFDPADMKLNWTLPITASLTDTPIVGQSTHTVADSTCYEAGDTWAVISDEGLAGTGTVVSVDDATNQVVIDTSLDATGTLTNPKLINTSVDVKSQFSRLKSIVDQIGTPVCEFAGVGDCSNTVFEISQNISADSSQVYIDGVRARKGDCGTLASLSNGAGNAELILTSAVLGLDGNDIDLVLVDPAAASSPLSVSVTGTYDGADRQIVVSLETDGGSAIISTAADVAAAINADADASRLVRALYGLDGLGVQAALAATPLAGGLNDGTGDYCELEGVNGNVILGSGFKFIAFHIRPDEPNRMSCPPAESEEIEICFSTAV